MSGPDDLREPTAFEPVDAPPLFRATVILVALFLFFADTLIGIAIGFITGIGTGPGA